MTQIAPYTDFAGNQLRVGDKIQHPDGSVATVTFDADRTCNFWRAVYDDGQNLALSIQVGDRGQAVRIDVAASSTQAEWSRWAEQRNTMERQRAQADAERLASKAADPFNQRGADRATEREIEFNSQKDRSYVN